WKSTLKAIEEHLVSDSLVYRYLQKDGASDGFDSEEGTFSLCSFWYIESLAKSGEVEKARLHFEKMLGYANHLGLFSEQIGLKGEQLGNFPQAFTHLALISAAYQLNRDLKGESKHHY
ncbi:MAG: glycoside hydrolase family 15 protein, partial [Pontibacter sp.]|nr:glycoside hydrolase family 15 protein [Pontibacter sp.]